MEPRNYTVNQLFNGTEVYVVPKYQRLYVWTKDDQWEPLWEDVKSIALELVSAQEGCDPDKRDDVLGQVESHFFGTLVLKQRGYTPESADRWRVIDGQQRLTTLQLMMSAVADQFRETGIPDQPIRNLIENRSTTNPLKIEHGSDNYEGFIDVMRVAADKGSVKGPMGEGYRFFATYARDLLVSDPATIETTAWALRNAIANKLRVVAIYLAGHEEEHKIFETLNARGKPLSEWDKIKNFLLYKADDDTDTTLDEYFDDFLDAFDQDWWRQEVGRGVGVRERSDVFADYWLESQMGTPVGARRVFRDFQSYVNQNQIGLVEMGIELTNDAGHFKKFEHRQEPATTEERRFHNRRLTIGIGAWWPMILKLNRIFNELNCDAQVRTTCFDFLESYLIRRLVVGHQARSYDQIGFEIMNTVETEATDSPSLVNALRGLLIGYSATGNRWPNDGDIRWAVLTRRMPSYVRRLVLEAFEETLIEPHASYQGVPTGLEIEHVMPQRWRDQDWPLQSDDDVADPVEARNDLIQTLGNLTLINGGLNKRLSNRSWEDKRKFIAKSDNLFINKQLLADAQDSWDENQIRSRGGWMTTKICEIWPGPEEVGSG